MKIRPMAAIAALVVFCAMAVNGQGATISSSQATNFIGTWMFAMTNPPNTEQTVRVWDNNGTVAASLQVGKFTPTNIAGVSKDGDMLVLTTTLRENGAPIGQSQSDARW